MAILREVHERRTSTGSEAFSLIVCLDATKFVLGNVFILVEAIWPKIWTKSLPKNEKVPLTVDVRRSKTSLLKLPIIKTDHFFKQKGIFFSLMKKPCGYVF